MNVRSLLSDAARTWPDRTAVVDHRGAVTFAELDARVRQLEGQLTRAGLRPGEGLGVMFRNGTGFVTAVFAGLGCGATVMPVHHQLKRAEIDGLLRTAPLHAVLDDRSGVEPVPGAESLGNYRFGRTGRPTGRFVPHVSDAAFVRFTSGTTGTSKGVVLGHRAVLARTSAAQQALGVGPDDVVVWVLPMAYHFVVTIMMYVRYGATIAVTRDMLASSILDTTEQQGGTMLYAAPMHYRMLAAEPSQRALGSLRLAISTSSAIPRDVALAFVERFQVPISQMYGIIEVGLPAGNLDHAEQEPDTIGRPLPHYEVGILDDHGEAVPDGEIGNLAMRGPGMFDAYLDPPRSREEVLVAGWFMTGDLARCTASGLIQVAGRRKSVINVSGLKVFPEEVEAVLLAHDQVADCQVVGVAHPIMGEVVHANVVPAPGVELDVDGLRRHCRARLSSFKVPQWIERVDGIARTNTGKVLRRGSST